MRVGGHGSGDLCEVQFHSFGIDAWQDQPRGCSASRTGRAEDIAPFVARIARGARAYPALCPDAGQRPLLINPCLVLEPYLQRLSLRPVWQDFRNQSGKVFFKSSLGLRVGLGVQGAPTPSRHFGGVPSENRKKIRSDFSFSVQYVDLNDSQLNMLTAVVGVGQSCGFRGFDKPDAMV